MWRPLLILLLVALGGCTQDPSRDDSRDGPATPAISGEITRTPRPLLLVTLDTTRADRLQPYGATDVATPTLLRLAREGIVFEQALSVAPITLVAHTSLLTGLYPPRHGVRNNGIHFVSEELTTLAEILGEHGYRSGAFVSASVLEKRYGLAQGFEVYDDDLSSGTNRQPRVVPDRGAGATVDAATAWLDGLVIEDPADTEDPTRPFFLWVHFYDPHAVYSPPAPYRDRYRERPYDGEIAYMDAELGRLLDHPALEDAAIAVIGDHGESLGEHGEQTHAILAYQSTLHVPFLLKVPGGPAGLRVEDPVSQVDFLPTALDLLGIEGGEAPAHDGRSLLPLLEGGEVIENTTGNHGAGGPQYAETYLPFYTYGWAKLRVLREGEWKLIDGPDPELYRLGDDAGEEKDLSAQEPRRLTALKQRLDLLLGEEELETSLELDEEARNRLRSLGYISSGGSTAHQGPRPDPKAFVDLHVGLERARSLLRERQAKEAENQLRRVLGRDPSNLAALTEMATAREMQGDLDGAVAATERALDLDPADSRLYLLMARLEQKREQPDKALELLDAALELSPSFLEARLEKASILTRLGRREAASLIEEILAKEGELPRILLAKARLPGTDAEQAESLLERALERDPFLVAAWRQKGRLAERRGGVEDAINAYRQGLQRAPDDVELHALMGRLLARTGGDAEVHLREALRLTLTPRPEVQVSLGAHIAEKGRLAEAIAFYDQVLAENPRHIGARNNRAVALYGSGRVEEALTLLEELAQEHPRHADAHNNLAALALDRGLWQDAQGHARRAIAADAEHANARLNLGLAQHGLELFTAAEKTYRRCLELDPDHVLATFHLARLLAAQPPRLVESARLLRQVAADIPSFSEPHLLLGELYAGPLRDPRRARAHLNAFVRLAAPNGDPRVQTAQKRLAELSLAGGA